MMAKATLTAETVMNEAVAAIEGVLVATDVDDYTDDDKITPREVRQFLARLRLLEGVPFSNLVADSALLPIESIRFFYVDRGWTDALTQGALSVGTVNTGDRAQLDRLYGAIEDEIDSEERLVRLPGGEERQAGRAGLMTGFLLRSRAVSGWPGLHVRAYAREPDGNDEEILPESHPDRLKLLRLERLAPAVMLALFDGMPEVVHIEEPKRGLQFGVSLKQTVANTYAASIPARNVQTANYVDENGNEVETMAEAKRLPVRFRPGSPGVLDLANTGRAFLEDDSLGMGSELDGAEFALQMIRFPYRQVFGDPQVTSDFDIAAVFRPTLSKEVTTLAADFERVFDAD
ncbi:hypothetical protein SAMN05444851_1545 [Aliiroseovarius sediminilitoris]|uniref:Uncharacterized protein n=2 Tax=Aliiroseovarius sediminilitoris TaxID=1173584 RepID=A0A1I0PCN9_9RHOB|nr:hypothetical protein SAMN05444851_1545 [Aliiroseovarius sediminilitoris]